MGRSCLALVKVIGRSRVPFPPLRTSPFISPSIRNATLHPGDVHELFTRTGSWWPGPRPLDQETTPRPCTLCPRTSPLLAPSSQERPVTSFLKNVPKLFTLLLMNVPALSALFGLRGICARSSG